MALSGTIAATSNNQYIDGTLTWSATQSISGNYSDVTATLRMERNNTGYTTSGTGYFKISINGTTQTASGSYTLTYNSNTLMITKTQRVYHNTDGTKSINISMINDSTYSGLPGTSYTDTYCSATVVLTTIPRASTIISFSIQDSFVPNASNNWINIGLECNSTSFTHDITLKYGTTTITSWLAQADDVSSLSLSSTIVNTMLNSLSSSTSGTFTITVQTKSGSTNIGSLTSKDATGSVSATVVPVITGLTATENEVKVSSSAAAGIFIQNLSKLIISLSGVTPGYGAAMSSYSTVLNGVTYTGLTNYSAVVTWSGTKTITATVTDSRGRTATRTLNVTVVVYSAPVFTSYSVERCDASGVLSPSGGTYLKITISGTVSSLVVGVQKNSWQTKVSTSLRPYTGEGFAVYQLSSGSPTAVSSTTVISGPFSVASSYDVVLSIVDIFNTSSNSTIISTAGFVLSLGDTGIGVGKIIETNVDANRVLDVQGNTAMDGTLGVASTITGGSFTTTGTTTTGSLVITGTGYDHGALSGKSDDDHTQYLNTTRHAAIKHGAYRTFYYQELTATANVGISTGINTPTSITGTGFSYFALGDIPIGDKLILSGGTRSTGTAYTLQLGLYVGTGGPAIKWSDVLIPSSSSGIISVQYTVSTAITDCRVYLKFLRATSGTQTFYTKVDEEVYTWLSAEHIKAT